jgi:predicted transcriptional regulator
VIVAPRSTTDLARDLVSRGDLLEVVVREAPVSTGALAGGLDASVSTVNRIVKGFVDAVVLERTDAGIVLTGYGEVVVAETLQFTRSIDTAEALHAPLDMLAETPVDFDIEWFADATISQATPTDPCAPLARCDELFTGIDRMRSVTDQLLVPTEVIQATESTIDDGLDAAGVLSESALTLLEARFPSILEQSTELENLTLWVAETVPFDLGLFDDHLLVLTTDDQSGVLSVLVDTDHPDAVAWGAAVFEACHADAKPVETVLDQG